jgi:dienelactone hydrolase
MQTINDLQQEVFRLYSEGQPAAALTLIDQQGGAFEHHDHWAQRMAFWRLCLYALTGQRDAAITVMGAALDRGLWFGEGQLLHDPDLDSLRGDPDFERLVKISQARQAEAQKDARPLLEVIEPAGAATPYPLLMALHGNNGSIAHTLPFWRGAADHGWLVAVPQSSEISYSLEAFSWNDHDRLSPEVQAHYAGLVARYPVDTRRVVIGGFSMGGRMAVRQALAGVIPARGVIAVSAALSPEDAEAWAESITAAAARGLRAAFVLGERDADRFIKGNQSLAAAFQRAGIDTTLHTDPDLAHDYPAYFATLLVDWLAMMSA